MHKASFENSPQTPLFKYQLYQILFHVFTKFALTLVLLLLNVFENVCVTIIRLAVARLGKGELKSRSQGQVFPVPSILRNQ